MLDGEGQRVAVAGGEQLGLSARFPAPDGADRVNHSARGERACGRDDGLARRQPFGVSRAANLFTLFKNFRAARPVNRAVNARAAEQRRVGRVDDGVNRFACDVAEALRRQGMFDEVGVEPREAPDGEADAPAEEIT